MWHLSIVKGSFLLPILNNTYICLSEGIKCPTPKNIIQLIPADSCISMGVGAEIIRDSAQQSRVTSSLSDFLRLLQDSYFT